jgi:glycosyltransferase involved in cell wall biosynthesis
MGAQGVISVSDSLKEIAVSNGIPESRIRVIGNGVDGDFFSCGDKMESRLTLGIGPNVKLIVSVGSIRRLKGFDILLDSIADLKPGPDFRCVIIGRTMESNFRDQLQSRIAELGMQEQIQLLGEVDPVKLVQWLRAADVFVLPTRREGCCNAVLEALSSGVPVISTPAGDNAKHIVDGRNGFLVPHESPNSLAQAISRSWGHPWDPQAISETVKWKTWNGVAKQVIDYFHECLNSR